MFSHRVLVKAILLILGSWSCQAQSVEIPDRDRTRILLGTTTTYTLRLKEARGLSLLGAVPKIDGLKLHVRPPVAKTISTLEGGVEVKKPVLDWQLLVQPQREGSFVLQGFSVATGGEVLSWDPLTLKVLSNSAADPHAWVNARLKPHVLTLGQEATVEVEVGVDREFFRTSSIPIVQQDLDLNVRLDIPWLQRMNASAVSNHVDGLSYVLNDRVVHTGPTTTRELDGREFVQWTQSFKIGQRSEGEFLLEEPLLRFAFATSFRTDFLGNRHPLDRTDAAVAGPATLLRVKGIPIEGQPESWSGAVGAFQIRTEASTDQISLGSTLELTLEVQGTGNLTGLHAPSITPLPGFHVLGTVELESTQPDIRQFLYSIAPTHEGVEAIPIVRFAYYQPGSDGAYKWAEAPPIPIQVHVDPSVSLAGLAKSGPPWVELNSPKLPAWIYLLIGLCWLVGAAVLLHLASLKEQRARDPWGYRKARARKRLDRDLRSGVPLAAAFRDYLAAKLCKRSAAPVRSDLRDVLARNHGVPIELGSSVAEGLRRLVEHPYRTREPLPTHEQVRSWADQLEAYFAEDAEESRP